MKPSVDMAIPILLSISIVPCLLSRILSTQANKQLCPVISSSIILLPVHGCGTKKSHNNPIHSSKLALENAQSLSSELDTPQKIRLLRLVKELYSAYSNTLN